MPTRAQVCAWIAGVGLVAPSWLLAQDRTEREVVELIVRDGPQARAIRAETEVTRREQLARLAYPNPVCHVQPGGCGLHGIPPGRAIAAGVRQRVTRCREPELRPPPPQRPSATLRLWLLRSDAAARRRSALSPSRNGSRPSEPHARAWNGSSRSFAPVSAKAKARDSIGSAQNRSYATPTRSSRPRRSHSPKRARLSRPCCRVTLLLTPVTATQITQPPSVPIEMLITRATSTRAELRALERSANAQRSEAEAARQGTASFADAVRRPETRGRRVGPRKRWRVRGDRVGAAVR